MRLAWQKFWLRWAVRASAYFAPSGAGDDFTRNMLTAHCEVRVSRSLLEEDYDEALGEIMADEAARKMRALCKGRAAALEAIP